MFDSWTMQSPPDPVNRCLCNVSCYIIHRKENVKTNSELGRRKMYVCEGETTPVKPASRITLNSGDQTINLFLME